MNIKIMMLLNYVVIVKFICVINAKNYILDFLQIIIYIISDPGCLQPFVIAPLGFELVAEGIIAARLVVDLLQHDLPSLAFGKIRIPALAVPEQAFDAVFRSADRDRFFHARLPFGTIIPQRAPKSNPFRCKKRGVCLAFDYPILMYFL